MVKATTVGIRSTTQSSSDDCVVAVIPPGGAAVENRDDALTRLGRSDSPAAPSIQTAPLTPAEARDTVADIIAAHQQTIESVLAASESGQRCQRLVAMFFDCGGADALDIHSPDAYLATALGVSRQHIHRLKKAGGVLRLLSPMGDVQLNERQVRPLVKLLDRPEDLKSAYDAALTDAGDMPVTGRHIAMAVAKCLPPAPDTLPNTDTDTDTKSNPNLNSDWLIDLHMTAAHWVDTLNVHPSAPQQLMHAVELVKKLAWNLHKEHKHEPDMLLHTT